MAAAKLLASHTHILSSLSPSSSSYSSLAIGKFAHQQPCPLMPKKSTATPRRHVGRRVVSSLIDPLPSSITSSSPLFLLAADTGYSVASYYTSLGLFVISVPGLWSLIKRSVKSKLVLQKNDAFFHSLRFHWDGIVTPTWQVKGQPYAQSFEEGLDSFWVYYTQPDLYFPHIPITL